MSYGNRLNEALTLAGKQRRDLARAIEVSEQAIGQVVNGKTVALTAENSAKAARFLGVDHYWLATGHGAPRSTRDLSPLGLALAKYFDQRVPMQLRTQVYANLTGAIDIAASSTRQPIDEPAPPATAPRSPR